MKTKHLSGILALVMILLSIGSSAKNPLQSRRVTFDQALELTWQNNPALKQAGYLRKQREQEARAAKGLFFPTIGISAGYFAMSDDITLDLTPVKDAITPLYSTLSQYGKFGGIPGLSDDAATQVIRGKLAQGLTSLNNANWNEMIQEKQFGLVAANFQWPLFTGGKIIAANKAAKIGKSEADNLSRQKEGEVITELVERYYGLSLASQSVRVRTEVLEGLNKHLEDAEKMEKQGLISHADLLHARVFHAQAERELSKAVQTSGIVEQALESTISAGDSLTVEPLSDLFYLDTIEPEAHFLELAKQNNPQLNEIEIKRLLSIQDYNAKRADWFPTIAAQGTWDIVNKDLSPYAPDWEVGIGLKWTLFDWTSRYNKVKAASMQTKQAEEVKIKATADIGTLVNKLYHELQMDREQLTELEAALQYATEYLNAREKEFHADMTNSTEVVDARLALAKVRIERLEVLYHYDLTLAQLLEVSGAPQDFAAYSKRGTAKTERYH
jgi:outer membrane protein TolC